MKTLNKSESNRRRFPRVRAPVFYRPASTFGTSRKATNLSLVGVRVYSNRPFKEAQVLEIELLLPSGESVKAVVRVVWIMVLPPGSDALYDVGLEFVKLPPDAVDKLKFVLEKSNSNE